MKLVPKTMKLTGSATVLALMPVLALRQAPTATKSVQTDAAEHASHHPGAADDSTADAATAPSATD